MFAQHVLFLLGSLLPVKLIRLLTVGTGFVLVKKIDFISSAAVAVCSIGSSARLAFVVLSDRYMRVICSGFHGYADRR